MRWTHIVLLVLLLAALCIPDPAHASAIQPASARRLFITLLPDFEDHSIQFDGLSAVNSPSDPLDLTGLPLQVEGKWMDVYTPAWDIRGAVEGGRLEYHPDEKIYHLKIGPLKLGPQDDLKLIFPFVNLDYARIEPAPDPPDDDDLEARQRTHRFTYRGGATGREIQTIDIPFTTITKTIDLTLTPLVGEALLAGKNGFRLSGSVLFGSISDFDEFTWHCQSTANRILHGDDYRSADLLYALDYPHYFGPDVLPSTYDSKPTIIRLRTGLATCQYDQGKRLGEVAAVFSGRTRSDVPDPALFPVEWREADSRDGNYPFVPPGRFRGVHGYEIRFGRILLAPGDTLTLTVPHTSIQVDSLSPVPDDLSHVDGENQQTKIIYKGPAAFDLSLPYVPQSGLYGSQFPALLRPAVSSLEEQFGEFFPLRGTRLTWMLLGAGLLLLALSRLILQGTWLAIPAWLLVLTSFFYGVRGLFGLLGIAILLYLSQTAALKDREDLKWKAIKALISFGLIAFAVYLDREGNAIFRGLSEPDLSPLTPLVLMVLIGGMSLVLYGRPKDAGVITPSDLPTLVLFLLVLALYDAFNKSLLALLILFAGALYVCIRAIRNTAPSGVQQNGNPFGKDLQSRLKLVFGNRIVPAAILMMIVFAIGNDFSSTYVNEMQIRISPLLSPLLIPLLAFVSVFLAFSSIALLYVLVYPFLPSTSGYIKASVFALFLFLIFLFGIGTDDRLIASLPNLLIGRVIYYLSVPLLIGIYIDIHEFMQKENTRLASEGKDEKEVNFQTAGSLYLKKLQGLFGALAGIVSLLAPTIFALFSHQPVITTYFSLLEKLVLLPL